MKKTSLAWSNLAHSKVRTSVAILGVTFAAVLMFMQLGFLSAVSRTATLIYGALDFDIVVRSPAYLHICEAQHFPLSRLQQVAAVPGVQRVTPFYITLNRWQNPRDLSKKRGILTMGVRPDSRVFRVPEIQTMLPDLVRDNSVLIDTKSKPDDYGPADGLRFGDLDIGQSTEITEKQVTIVGCFELGTGLAANAAVLMNDLGFSRVSPGRSTEMVSLGLVKVGERASDQEIEEVAARIRQALAGKSQLKDVRVLSRKDVVTSETHYWLFEKSIGIIFMMGVAVAFVVGMAIVYQVLAGDVASHLGEYATLKAMGYRNRYLGGVVIQQAVLLAIGGFLVAMLIAFILFRWTSWKTGIVIRMEFVASVVVLAASLVMSCGSGLAALRKAFQADPADLF